MDQVNTITNKCNILICGFREDCGFETIQILIDKLIDNDLFNNNSHNDISIIRSCNFFNIYPIIKSFDHIILCRRNILDISDNIKEMIKWVEIYNCWSLFASIIIPYEDSSDISYNKLYKMFNRLESTSTITNNKILNYLNY